MYEVQITRGVARLDERLPVGGAWVGYVDLATLDMADYRHCVVGQVVRTLLLGHPAIRFTHALELLGIGGSGAGYGFELMPHTGWTVRLDAYRRLTAEWVETLLTLRRERGVPRPLADAAQR